MHYMRPALKAGGTPAAKKYCIAANQSRWLLWKA